MTDFERVEKITAAANFIAELENTSIAEQIRAGIHIDNLRFIANQFAEDLQTAARMTCCAESELAS
jgi:hypothetical protein